MTPRCFDQNTDQLIHQPDAPLEATYPDEPRTYVDEPVPLKDWAVSILTIDHETQRYPTVGDWQYNTSDVGALLNLWDIRVSKMSKWQYEFLVALHELVEMGLCHEAGIREEDVTAFDLQFEVERAQGRHDHDDEPGDDPRAPYHVQHKIASMVEHFVASKLHVNWHAYEQEVEAL